jgi:prephenate dehydrogenase
MDFRGLNIAVVGLGLIGGSYAMALRDIKPSNIFGIDHDHNTISKAKEAGVIDNSTSDTDFILKKSDIVIIALYPKDTVDFIRNNLKSFKKGAIITDATGIKDNILKEINDCLRQDLDFIGGHPMAGKAESGFSHADKAIFQGANYILTPTEKNKKENISLISNMAIKIGFSNVILLSPEEHDKVITLTSHLPHIVAVALMNSTGDTKDIPKLVGGSFKDATRVAAMNSNLWCELLLSNGSNISTVIDIFQESLFALKKAIINKEEIILKAMFESAYMKRKEII